MSAMHDRPPGPREHHAEELRAPAQPRTLTANEMALEAVAEMREAAELTRTATDQLLEISQRLDRPAEMRTWRIPDAANGANPVISRHRNAYKSLGLWVPAGGVAGGGLNPNGAGVYLGAGGNSGRTGVSSPFCAPGKAIVLPVSDIDIEFGADSAVLAGSSVTFFAFYFAAVQPLYVGG